MHEAPTRSPLGLLFAASLPRSALGECRLTKPKAVFNNSRSYSAACPVCMQWLDQRGPSGNHRHKSGECRYATVQSLLADLTHLDSRPERGTQGLVRGHGARSFASLCCRDWRCIDWPKSSGAVPPWGKPREKITRVRTSRGPGARPT